jgi:hypothetical protein
MHNCILPRLDRWRGFYACSKAGALKMKFLLLSLRSSLIIAVGFLQLSQASFAQQANADLVMGEKLSVEAAAKLYFSTVLASKEFPGVEQKLEAALKKHLSELEKKYDSKVKNINSLRNRGTSVSSLLGIAFVGGGLNLITDGALKTGSGVSAAGLLLLGSSSYLSSSFSHDSVFGSMNEDLKKGAADGQKKASEDALKSAWQQDLNFKSGLLGKLLKWTPDQERKFADAYRNALIAGATVHAPRIDYVEQTRKGGGHNDSGIVGGAPWTYESELVPGRLEMPSVNALDIIQKYKLASPSQIKAIREIEKDISDISSTNDKIDSAERESRNLFEKNVQFRRTADELESKIAVLEKIVDAIREVQNDPDFAADKALRARLEGIQADATASIRRIKNIADFSRRLN